MPAKKKASAVHKVNIHEIMNAIDYRNGNYYTDLDDDLLMVNDLSNIDYIATTSGHEELRYRVLALIGLGQKLRHEFVPPKGAKKDKLREWLLELLPHCNDDEVELFREINDSSVLQDIATAKNTV